MKNYTITLIAICSLLIFSSLSFAQGPGEPFHPMTADGALNIAWHNHILFWENPTGTVYNEVYFSSDSTLVASLDPTVRIYNGYPSTAYTSADLSIAGYLPTLTKYYWRVVEYDSSGATAGGVWNFITRISATGQILLYDDFTNGTGNWTITNEGGNCVWMTADISSDGYQLPSEASGNIFTANSHLCGQGTSMNTSATFHKMLYNSYDWDLNIEWDNDWYVINSNDSASVEISSDNGSSWNVILSRYGVNERNTYEWTNIAPFNSNSVMVRFHTVQPGWDWWWAIDNVKIELLGPLTPPLPPNLLESFSYNDTLPRVNLNWDSGFSPDPITGYLLQRKQGLPTDTTSYVTVVETDPYTFSYTDFTVEQNGIYTYKILTVAGPDSSIWGNEATAYVPQIVPVELISFNASVINNEVQLSWQTATETNNHGFEIERKQISGDWLRIGFIEGNGTTTELQNYSFIDDKIEVGKYQYSLKQIDYNGTYEYSNIIEVEIAVPTKFSLEQNYPNPFNPTTKIKFSIAKSPLPGGDGRGGLVTLKVYDVLEREVATLVNEEKSAGTYEVEFNASNLPSGIYFYRLKSGSFSSTKKLILLK